MVDGIIFILKGIVLTEVLTRAARTWGVFDGFRAKAVRIDFLRRLLGCFECTSVWAGTFVAFYLFFFEVPILTYLLLFSGIARWLNVLYEYLDACRATKEGEL